MGKGLVEARRLPRLMTSLTKKAKHGVWLKSGILISFSNVHDMLRNADKALDHLRHGYRVSHSATFTKCRTEALGGSVTFQKHPSSFKPIPTWALGCRIEMSTKFRALRNQTKLNLTLPSSLVSPRPQRSSPPPSPSYQPSIRPSNVESPSPAPRTSSRALQCDHRVP